MSRRKKGNPVHGWVVLDKPLGMTSTQAVGAVRRLFEAQKAGHAGTLDPLATGILPIALGEATKTVPFAVDGEKAYRFSVRFGIETDTDDAEGQIVRTSERLPTADEIADVLADFTGEISQVPPAFSAIKVDGNRAYDLARSGEMVVLDPRWIVVEDLRLIEMPDAATAVLEAECGKGTYVRALARDMGRALGSAAHVIGLRRTRVGGFDEAVSVDMATLREAAEAGDVGRASAPRRSGARRHSRPRRRTRRCSQLGARPDSAGARARCADPQRCGVCALQRPHSRPRRAGKGRLPADPRVQFRLMRLFARRENDRLTPQRPKSPISARESGRLPV